MSLPPIPLAAETHGHLDLSAVSPLEWVVLGLTAAAALWSIWRAVRLTLAPGEREPAHIKRLVLVEPTRIEAALRSPAIGAASDGGGATEEGLR
jgi:hypothetical protein